MLHARANDANPRPTRLAPVDGWTGRCIVLSVALVLAGWTAPGDGYGEAQRVATPPHADGEAMPAAAAALPGWTEGLDYAFVQIEQAIESAPDGAAWRETAASRDVPVDADGRLFVYVDANGRLLTYNDGELINEPDTISDELKDQLPAVFPGVEIRPTVSTTRFWAWVPPMHVRPLFEWLRERMPNVSVQRPERPISNSVGYGTVVSQGVTAMDVDNVHLLNVRGGNVPVAVLDLEFGDVTSFSSETGSIVTHPTQQDLASDPGRHGTACLEVLRDVAPTIGPVYAVREADNLDMQTIVAWLTTQSPRPQIVSHSTAYFGYPGNGSAADAARAAMVSGMHWVVAAGNFANGRYWEAASPSFSGPLVQFAPGATANALSLSPGQGRASVVFSYERPNSSYATLRVLLYENAGSGPQVVDAGNGSAFSRYVTTSRTPGASYSVVVERVSGGTVGRLRVQVADGISQLQHSVTQGSLTNPAAVNDPRLVSVGAVGVANYNASGAPAGYSSRGGGVFNLRLVCCGPTNVATASLGTFSGTSAAAPHVAGLLALNRSHAPFAADPLGNVAFTDILTTGYDDDSGEGLARADLTAFLGSLPDRNEPNDGMSEATFLGVNPRRPGASRNVSLYPVGDVDWYEFELTEAVRVRMGTSGPEPADTVIRLYDGQGTLIEEDFDGQGTPNGYSWIGRRLGRGRYFIEVREANDAAIVANYTLDVVASVTESSGCAASPAARLNAGTWLTATLLLLTCMAIARRRSGRCQRRGREVAGPVDAPNDVRPVAE